MNRGLSSANQTAAAASTTYPVCFWYGDFASGAVRITDHHRDLIWGGYTWTALGQLVGVSEIKETAQAQANSVEFFLNGVDTGLLVKALEAGFRKRACVFYLGFLDASGALVDTPVAWPFLMDRMPIRRGGTTARITVIAESRLVDLQRSSELRLDDEQQQGRFAGDRGFQYVVGIQEAQVPVGGAIDGGLGVSQASQDLIE